MNRLQAEFGSKGLTIIASHRQNATDDKIKQVLGDASYPVTKFQPSAYAGGGGIPYGFIVGVEGTVLWKGNPGRGNIDKIIKDEIAKIKYPGLGKLDVAKGLKKSATKYIEGDLTDAREEAKKAVTKATKKAMNEDGTIDESKLDEDAKAVMADAKYIIDKVAARAESLKSAAEAATEESKHYVAYKSWNKIVDLFGKKSDEGTEAKKMADAMMKDKAIKKEIKASEDFEELVNGKKFKGKSTKVKNKLLKSFVKKNKGTSAASEAEAMITEE